MKPNWIAHILTRGSCAPDYQGQYRHYREDGLKAFAEGRLDDATENLGRAALLCPQDVQLHFDLGRALQAHGKIEAARRAYLYALQLTPKSTAIRAALLALPPLPPGREDFHPGQKIDAKEFGTQFTVFDTKRGGFGAVHLVRSEKSGSLWALKTFQAKYLWSDNDRKRFEREAVTWLMLNRHPNIVFAQTLINIEAFPCLILEYVPGGSLAELLLGGPLPLESAISFALQFCDGMFYANQTLGIVHRDIKPSNCLLSEDHATLKIADFGLARAFAEGRAESLGLSDLTAKFGSQFTTVAGTPHYMAPEQFRVDANLDTRTDVYAFGVMFYQMLTGNLPQMGPAARAHIEANAVASPLVPRLLLRLILKCVDQKVSGRPKDFGEVRGALDKAYADLLGKTAPPIATPCQMTVEEWNDKGCALNILGYPKKAWDCYLRALMIEPFSASVHMNCGLASMNAGRFKNALSNFEMALALSPEDPATWINKGYALDMLGRTDEARACYERALQLDPENDALLLNVGAMLDNAGQLESALLCYDRGLEINPRNVKLWVNKSIIFSKEGRYEEALACCSEGLGIDPRHNALWAMRSYILKKLDRLQEALAACIRGLEINADDANLWGNRGELLTLLNRPDEAQKCFERARALNVPPS